MTQYDMIHSCSTTTLCDCHLRTHLSFPILIWVSNPHLDSHYGLTTTPNLPSIWLDEVQCVGSWGFTQPIQLHERNINGHKVFMDFSVHWCCPYSKYFTVLEAHLLKDLLEYPFCNCPSPGQGTTIGGRIHNFTLETWVATGVHILNNCFA